MKDELDAEVDKKYNQIQESFDHGKRDADEEDYDDDDFVEGRDDLKEDTIMTDKIEKIVEEED